MSTKTAVGVAAVVTVLLSGIVTYEIRAQREALARLATAEREAAGLQANLRSEQDRIARERATVVPTAAPTPLGRPVGDPGPTIYDRIAQGRAFMKANPEFATAFAAYLKNRLRLENADLIARMGLSGPEADRFIEVLANGHMQPVGQHFLRLQDDEMTSAEFTRQLKDVLGEERYRMYQADDRMSPVRSLTGDLVRALYYTPTPLTPRQIEGFRGVMQQALDDRSLGPRYSGGSMYMPLAVWDALQTRAAGTLSAAQLEALANLRTQAAYFHAQIEARKAYDKEP